MRIIKKYDVRKNEILDIAEALFASKGYEKTTVNNIIDAVGIAKGTFYHYFESKEEVLNAIVVRYVDVSAGLMRSIADDTTLTAAEKMRKILTLDYKKTTEQLIIFQQLFKINNAEMQKKRLLETVLRITKIISKVALQGVEEGIYTTPYPVEAVELMLICSQALFEDGLYPMTPEEMTQKAKAHQYFIEKTFGAESGSFSYILDVVQKRFIGEKEVEVV